MKNSMFNYTCSLRNLLSIGIIILLLGLYSCETKVYENKLVINSDGSCEKTISILSDTSIITGKDLPILIDSSWKTTINLSKFEKKGKYKISSSKKFNHVNDINAIQLNNKNDWHIVKREYKLEKRFRWFYTYFDYSEYYPAMNPFTKIPISDYLSEDEILLLMEEKTEYLAGRDSAEIVAIRNQIIEKGENWLNRAAIEELDECLVKSVNILKSNEFTLIKVQRFKNQLLEQLKIEKQKRTLLVDNIFEAAPNIYPIIDSLMNINVLAKNHIAIDSVFNPFFEKLKFIKKINFIDKETNTITIPGIIVSSSAKKIIGNQFSWDINVFKCFWKSYEIKTTSRQSNSWTFIITALLTISAFVVLFLGSKLRNKKN